jgi:superfamily II DNA or RNA helicase
MEIDYIRLDRQQLGCNRFFDADCKGALVYATGVGKTYTAILIIKKMFSLFPNTNITLLVPSDITYQQWTKEIETSFNKKQQGLIYLFTPHQIINRDIKIKTDFLIVDELHEFYTEEYIKCINGTLIQFGKNLGLTANYEDSKNRQKSIETIFPVIDKIDEAEAIAKGFISACKEFNLSIALTEKEKEDYQSYSNAISKNLSKFGGNLELALKCLSGGNHNGVPMTASQFVFGWAKHKGWNNKMDMTLTTNVEIDAVWNPGLIFGYAKHLMSAIKKRKDLVYNAENKFQIIKNIFFNYPDYKSIIFSQSTDFADRLNKVLNEYNPDSSVVYHSKLKTELRPGKTGKLLKFGKARLKKEALTKIKTGEALRLCTASSLDKGFDEPSIVLGITASGHSGFVQYNQRNGRVKRKIKNDDGTILLINLYCENTKEKDWLTKRQSKVKHPINWVDDYNDINLEYINKPKFTFNTKDL